MKKSQRIVKGIIIYVLILCVFFTSFPVNGAEKEERDKVKVGFFTYDGYHNIDSEGIRSGYGYDFLRMAARYWNVEYEYIGYENSWEDMIEMLRNGEIDLLTSARNTPERVSEFAFSKPIGTSSAMLTTRSNDNSIVSGDYLTYDGLRIGLLKENSRNKDLRDFAKENAFSYEAVYYELPAELEDALKNEEIDAILTSSLRKTTGERVLDYFAVEQFYAMVRKEDTELLKQLNYAIDQLDAVEGDWKNELNNKHYFHQEQRKLSFTFEEWKLLQQYKDGEKELVVSVCTDKKPYAYEENGEVKGILVDYFALLADYVGVPYKIVAPADREEYLHWCEEENVANVFLDGRFSNEQQMEEMGKSFTETYTTMRLAKVTRRDFDGEIDTLAVSTSQGLFGIEDGLAPRAKRMEVDTRTEAMEAVLKGKADATFVYLHTAQQFVNQDERGLLTYTMLENPTYEYHVTFAAAIDNRMSGIFTKAIHAVPAETLENIASQYTIYKAEEVDFITWVKIHPATMFFIAAVVLFICFLTLLLRQREKAMRMEQKRSAQLQELAHLADSASRAKSTFLSNMSHDIRTPMNAIVGITNLMSYETGLSEQMEKYIQKVQLSSQYLLNLLNDVLDMSKIEANEVVLKEEAFSLSKQILQVSEMIQRDADAKNQTFLLQTEKFTHDIVVADSVRLRQILINLLTNAVKYTPMKGQISLTVEEFSKEEEYIDVRFVVADDGMGMSREFLEHIFDPFARGENSVTNKVQGTGLGMPITKNLVDLMGGDIQIESEVGKGTTITVILPLKKDPAPTTKQEKMPASTEGKEQNISEISPDTIMQGRRFLCAEDNDLNAEILEALLEMNGATCIIYEDGVQLTEAFQTVQDGECDAILMDIQMPHMNGLDAAKAIRAGSNPLGKTIPIIAMTANAFTEDVENAKAAGMDAHLSKPLDIEKLKKALYQLLVGEVIK